MKRIVGQVGLALSVVCTATAWAAGDEDPFSVTPPAEDVVVFAPGKPASEPRETAPDTGTSLAAGTEAEVVEGALDKGCARVKITQGPHAGETLWVPANCIAGSGKLHSRNAGDDSTAKIPAYRDEATYQKSQKSEGSSSDAFMGIMSDEVQNAPHPHEVLLPLSWR